MKKSCINSFIKCVEKNEFKKAHEYLEEEWKEYRKKGDFQRSRAVKGLINGSTALELYKRDRLDAYKKIWKVFEKYKPLLKELKDKNLNDLNKYFEARDLLEFKKKTLIN